MNKAINESFDEICRLCIFHIQQFKTVGNFEKIHFRIDVNGDVAKNCKNNLTFSLNDCSLETHV